jgi:hypothetical protein
MKTNEPLAKRLSSPIDIAPDGTVYGVELLNPKEQLTGDHGTLIVESGANSMK